MYLLMAFVQVPFGLMTLKSDRLSRLIAGVHASDAHWTKREVIVLFIMVACCLFAGLGLTDAFTTKTARRIFAGVVVGLLLASVEIYVMAFLGCCAGLSHL